MVNTVQELFSKRLRKLREDSGITMVELAGVLGMSQATISEWEKGNKFPRAGALQGLAIHFNVPMEYFFKEDVLLVTETVKIPLYTKASQSTQSMCNGISDKKVEYIKLPASFLGSYYNEDGLEAFVVLEDGMDHLFPNGSTIVVKRVEQRDLVDGDIVVYFFQDAYAIRRFRKNDAKNVFLFKPESTNPLLYDVVIPFEEIGNVEVLAKVIWYGVLV
ncbi:XRE family transcriptional regulator [Sporosarcina siberiensis]|uniref:XRE family transcriptional regulator n=1 Tax=Sporosarcina siberiensis TaxID=1365606 RepID=A0ABW4SJI0_9BACL